MSPCSTLSSLRGPAGPGGRSDGAAVRGRRHFVCEWRGPATGDARLRRADAQVRRQTGHPGRYALFGGGPTLNPAPPPSLAVSDFRLLLGVPEEAGRANNAQGRLRVGVPLA